MSVNSQIKSSLKSGVKDGSLRSVTITEGNVADKPSSDTPTMGKQGSVAEFKGHSSLDTFSPAPALSGANRERPSMSRGSDSSRGSADEILKAKGYYANAIGMIAASSQAGGKGVNCTKFEGLRYDGRVQKEVIKELEDAVAELGNDEQMLKPKAPNLLSPFETISNRANDLSTWYGIETTPDHYSTHRDTKTGMVLVRYDGEFEEKQGKHVRQGHATVRAVNGIIFEGNFEDGVMQGRGKVVFPSGNVWKGEFDNGRMHGEGVFDWAPPPQHPSSIPWKKRYIGVLVDGKILSKGQPSTYLFQKHVYEGEFVDGCAHGRGVMLWPQGHYYDGEWLAGKPHGEGNLVMPDGVKKSGYYEPCAARWYAPLIVDKAFWPGQIEESALLRVDEELPPAQERVR